MNTNEITIPENIQDICREFAEIARKHDLIKFSLNFAPSFEMGWGGDVHCFWEWGRHGDGSNVLKIQSSFYVSAHVSKKIDNE